MRDGRKPNKENLLWFLQDMLKKVIEVYEEENLPHYFLSQMNLFETFPVEKRDALLKTVEIAKKFNSKNFLITMVKSSSQIFQGIYIDSEDRFYFSLFFNENIVPCTRNNLRDFLKDINHTKTVKIRRNGSLIY